jgi:hypothetical protein
MRVLAGPSKVTFSCKAKASSFNSPPDTRS